MKPIPVTERLTKNRFNLDDEESHIEVNQEIAKATGTGKAIVAAVSRKRTEPLFLMIDGDIGRTIGRLLHEELGLPGPLVSIDGVQLQDLDYVDVGELMSPPGVVPVVIKSLLFS